MTKISRGIVQCVEFEVDDKMVIIDPCYVDEDDAPKFELLYGGEGTLRDGTKLTYAGSGVVVPDCAGTWMGEIELDHGRVSILRLTHQARRPADWFLDALAEHGVDSGQMYAGCLSNLPLDYERLLSKYTVDPDKPFGGDNYSNANILAAEGGVVSSTGYGDGSYYSYVQRDKDGRPVVIEVRFMEEDDEE